jgi:protein-tyrosine phosphatase
VHVLFVCSGNAHRSPLAEALLRKFKPDWKVDSAGVHVAIPIAEEVREYLMKEGAEQYLKSKPESVGNKRLMEYDVIVAMENRHKDYVLRLCPECKDKITVWNIKDPYFMNKENAWKIYEQIKEKVTQLAKTQ